jgi:hypothetical protein
MSVLTLGRPIPNGTSDSVGVAVVRLPLPEWLVEGKRYRAFHLDIPLPPSTNALWKIAQVWRNGVCVGSKMVKTPQYTDWITEAGYTGQWPRGYEDWTGIVLLYVDCGQMAPGRDTDNTIKAVQDLAASMMGVNDSCFHWSAAFRSEDHGIAAGKCGVTLVLVEG